MPIRSRLMDKTASAHTRGASDPHPYMEAEGAQCRTSLARKAPLGASKKFNSWICSHPSSPTTLITPILDGCDIIQPSNLSSYYVTNSDASQRRNATIDLALVPRPLRWRTSKKVAASDYCDKKIPSPTDDESVLMSAAIDTHGTLRKSLVMSMFEKQGPGTEPSCPLPFKDLIHGDIPYSPQDFGTFTESREQYMSEPEAPIIYFLPSPSPSRSLLTQSIANKVSGQSNSKYMSERGYRVDKELDLPIYANNKASGILGKDDSSQFSDSRSLGKPLLMRSSKVDIFLTCHAYSTNRTWKSFSQARADFIANSSTLRNI